MKEFVRDMWRFLKYRKKFWLTPIILVVIFMTFMTTFTQGSAVAPFVYTLF